MRSLLKTIRCFGGRKREEITHVIHTHARARAKGTRSNGVDAEIFPAPLTRRTHLDNVNYYIRGLVFKVRAKRDARDRIAGRMNR